MNGEKRYTRSDQGLERQKKRICITMEPWLFNRVKKYQINVSAYIERLIREDLHRMGLL
jgi:post-segregation antitoxin (ccd killing protein)